MLEKGGYNRGAFIDRANIKYAYLKAPYCASGQSLAMNEYNASVPQDKPYLKITLRVRSARAKDFITSYSIDARDVYYNKVQMPDEVFSIYTRTGGGHIAYKFRDKQFHFNSSPGGGGSMWDGMWSGWKTDNVRPLCSPLCAFRIIAFTPLV